MAVLKSVFRAFESLLCRRIFVERPAGDTIPSGLRAYRAHHTQTVIAVFLIPTGATLGLTCGSAAAQEKAPPLCLTCHVAAPTITSVTSFTKCRDWGRRAIPLSCFPRHNCHH